MAGGCAWSRRVAVRQRTLRGLVRDTQRALHDVTHILHTDPEIAVAVQELASQSSRSTAVVLLGCNAAARARLLHCLLGRKLLPEPPPRGTRWLRIQYGSSTQVQLTLGNSEFELVEELECNKGPWETIPVEDLIRQDQTDLATMLEVELNNSFLKDGLKIIIPPDLESDPGTAQCSILKQKYSELYAKRDLILKSFNTVYLYAVDRMGKSVFSESIVCDQMVSSQSEEDFWTMFNMYSMAKGGCGKREESAQRRGGYVWREASSEPSVLSSENCLDLHQIKEINPKAQVMFMLFSDSEDLDAKEIDARDRERQMLVEATESAEERERERLIEATESTEEVRYSAEDLPEADRELLGNGPTEESQEATKRDARRLLEEQIAFMNDLLDQWELMASPPPKHYAKSQWCIIDDVEILRTADTKPIPTSASETTARACKREEDRRVKNRSVLLSHVVKFATECCQSYLLEYSTKLSEIHVKLVQQLVLASFDLARELQLVPRKIQYVASQERQLYQTINEKFSEGDKKQELLQIMEEVLNEIRGEINNMDWSVDDLPWHQDRRFVISNSIFYSSSQSSPEKVLISIQPPDRPANPADRPADHPADQPSDGEEAVSYDSYNFDDYEIIQSNDECLSVYDSFNRRRVTDSSSLTSQPSAIRVENESELSSVFSTQWRMDTLSSTGGASTATGCTNSVSVSVKHASLDVQQTVLSKLSRKISLKLVKFVDCLKDTYFGTLQRCLESLEAVCRAELGGRPASEAMRALVSVARSVDLQPCASYSALHQLLDNIRRLFHKLRLSSSDDEEACCVLSPAWRRRVATHTAHSLTPQRLARVISTQILERLSEAHERYQSALASLEAALAGRLHHTEDIKLAIRKKYAPSFARLCLESTSMCDLLMYGTPELGREIGRGQYGVVYAARGAWGGHSPVAVKSVLPADERHYHELAMEFFYTRSIPSHPRIVRLHGSVVQRAGGGGGGGGAGGPCVLLVSERKTRDLHHAVRAGLTFARRMRVSADIVEGIRYLHSLGLVHRDIKMKNVLLDAHDRAALSDLGFCAAEALISGSVVGTPVHMAPELLAGEYDAAVDVYAFGILFWYVCAGNIKLPSAFEAFQNKEQLWSKVKRGLRPERLPHFPEECWEIMEACWASEPHQRALLGDIQPKLERILEQALRDEQTGTETPRADYPSDDDSLDLSGVRNQY